MKTIAELIKIHDAIEKEIKATEDMIDEGITSNLSLEDYLHNLRMLADVD